MDSKPSSTDAEKPKRKAKRKKGDESQAEPAPKRGKGSAESSADEADRILGSMTKVKIVSLFYTFTSAEFGPFSAVRYPTFEKTTFEKLFWDEHD